MIAVLADDLTGAAELGGIGLRYGFSVEINTAVPGTTKADLLIIAADTRSMEREQAVREIESLTKALSQLRPTLIYKKVDSVLRGHVVAEIKTQLKVLGLKRSLLVPANPALGRTIQDGVYLLHGQPVHLSSFALDPEFPITRSGVQEMLQASEEQIWLRRPVDDLPEEGIIVGEVSHARDLQAWTGRMEEDVLAAGAAGFFTALLDRMNIADRKEPAPEAIAGAGITLVVCGSTYDKSRRLVRNIKEQGGPVSYMPAAIAAGREAGEVEQETGASGEETRAALYDAWYEVWYEDTLRLIRDQGRAIIAIDPATTDGSSSARLLRERMARLVRLVLQGGNIEELFIEGGSTAFAILQTSGLQVFSPVQELSAGVIRMSAAQSPGLHITVKPGSYDWPASAQIFAI